MEKTVVLKLIIAFFIYLAVLAVFYLTTAFIELSLDPTTWPLDARAFVGVMGNLVAAAVSLIVHQAGLGFIEKS